MAHLLANLVQFIRLLRLYGLQVSPENSVTASRALQYIDIGNRTEFKHALRCVLVHRNEDIDLFEQVFQEFWSSPSDTQNRLNLHPLGSERRFGEPVVEMASLTGSSDGTQGEDGLRVERVQIATYSNREVLKEKDFKNLTAEEMEQAAQLLHALQWRPEPRRSKRWIQGSGNSPDPRRLLSSIARNESQVFTLPRRMRKPVARPLVLLCDISGSMERYTRMLLWFSFCLSGKLGRVESFLFATRLTRITHQLSRRHSWKQLQGITRHVPDWSGGTRIGEVVRIFNVQWARRILGRGAVVLVVSDGWDRGDPDVLECEVARLQRSCHRLIWLSPLLGSPSYKPLTRGLQSALPYVDDFLPIHNLESLDRLAGHLNSLPAKRTGHRTRVSRSAMRSVC